MYTADPPGPRGHTSFCHTRGPCLGQLSPLHLSCRFCSQDTLLPVPWKHPHVSATFFQQSQRHRSNPGHLVQPANSCVGGTRGSCRPTWRTWAATTRPGRASSQSCPIFSCAREARDDDLSRNSPEQCSWVRHKNRRKATCGASPPSVGHMLHRLVGAKTLLGT